MRLQESTMSWRFAIQIVLAFATAVLAGCSDWTGSHATPSYLPAPGQYAPPAEATPRLRVAVPAMAVDNPVGVIADLDVQAAASDELFALLDASSRYDLTERQRLAVVLAEQKHSDMIQPGRLIHPAPVQGFDYALLGHFTQFLVQREPEPGKMSMASMQKSLHMGAGWIPRLIADARVDLTMVDVHTGVVIMSGASEFHHTMTPQELGLQLTSDQLLNTPLVRLNSADTRHILRLVLDDTLRPLLPRLDRWAAALPPSHDGPPAVVNSVHSMADNPLAAQSATRPAGTVLNATSICPECGAKVRADQEFCPVCGHKLR
jgi:curli biogenesis system outer membrane secretion channel CsgG